MGRDLANHFALVVPPNQQRNAALPISNTIAFDDLGDFAEERQRIQRKLQELQDAAPKVDFSDYAKHVFFDSALSKFAIAKNKILNSYPYSGDSEAIDLFYISGSLFENYITGQWPRSVGYVSYNGGSVSITASDYTGQLHVGSSSLYVSARLTPAVPSANYTVVSVLSGTGIGSQYGYQFLVATNSMTLRVISGAFQTDYTGTFLSTPISRRFATVAAMYDANASNVSLYLDNTLIRSVNNVDLTSYMQFGPAKIAIGSSFSGNLGEVRVLHTASALFHQKNYNRPITSENYVKLNYRFNEGMVGDARVDQTIIDYSQSKLHGKVVNYVSSFRHSGTTAFTDPGDPILYAAHPAVVAYTASMETSASIFDSTNRNYIFRLIPETMLIDDQDSMGLLISFSLAMARYFDELKMYLDQFDNLRVTSYSGYDESPDLMLPLMKRYFGWKVTDHFSDSNPLQFLFGENVLASGSLDIPLIEIRNQFWRRILSNLPYLYSGKGKRDNINAFFNVLGINPSLMNLKEYGTPGAGTILDEYLVKQQPMTFLGLAYQNFVTSPPIAPVNADTAHPFTIEAIVKCPLSGADLGFRDTGGVPFPFNSGSIFSIAYDTFSATAYPYGLAWSIPAKYSITGSVWLVASGTTAQEIPNVPLFDGQTFTHFSLVYDGNMLTVGIRQAPNGILTYRNIQSFSASGSPGFISSSYFQWGGSVMGSTTAWNSYFGQASAWNIALSDADLDAHAVGFQTISTAQPVVSGAYLVAHYALNENITSDSTGSLKIPDQSQYNNTPTSEVGVNSNPYKAFPINYASLSPAFDLRWTQDKIRIRNKSKLTFKDVGNDTNQVALEFNLVDALNADIVKIFTSMDTMNNVLGAPINKYRDSYNDLEAYRQTYFAKLTDNLSFNNFFKLFQWFDKKLAVSIRQLMPARADFIGGEFVVDSHMLERNKYQYQYPIFHTPKNVDVGNIAEMVKVSGSVQTGLRTNAIGTYTATQAANALQYTSTLAGATITNFLPSNIATGTDTNGDTTGFYTSADAVIFSDAEYGWQGARSLNVLFPATSSIIGTVSFDCSGLGFGSFLTLAMRVRNFKTGSANLQLDIAPDGLSTAFTIDQSSAGADIHGWQTLQYQWFSLATTVTFTLGETNTGGIRNVSGGLHFNVDGIMLTTDASADIWADGVYTPYQSGLALPPRRSIPSVLANATNPSMVSQFNDQSERSTMSFMPIKVSGDEPNTIRRAASSLNNKNVNAKRIYANNLANNNDGYRTGSFINSSISSGLWQANGYVFSDISSGVNAPHYQGVRKHIGLSVVGFSSSLSPNIPSDYRIMPPVITVAPGRGYWLINTLVDQNDNFIDDTYGPYFLGGINGRQEKVSAIFSYYVSGALNASDFSVQYSDLSTRWPALTLPFTGSIPFNQNMTNPSGTFVAAANDPGWYKFTLYMDAAYGTATTLDLHSASISYGRSFPGGGMRIAMADTATTSCSFKNMRLDFMQPLSDAGVDYYDRIGNTRNKAIMSFRNDNLLVHGSDVMPTGAFFPWTNTQMSDFMSPLMAPKFGPDGALYGWTSPSTGLYGSPPAPTMSFGVSYDYGATVNLLSTLPVTSNLQNLGGGWNIAWTMDAVSASIVYAGSAMNANANAILGKSQHVIAKSLDGGQTWTEKFYFTTSASYETILGIASAPDGYVYISTPNVVIVSNDHAKSGSFHFGYAASGIGGAGLAIDPGGYTGTAQNNIKVDSQGTVYSLGGLNSSLGTYNFWMSVNSGSTFVPIFSSSVGRVGNDHIADAVNQVVYVARGNTIFSSSLALQKVSASNAWWSSQVVLPDPGVPYFSLLGLSPRGTVYCVLIPVNYTPGLEGSSVPWKVARSADFGVTWTTIDNSLGSSEYMSIAPDGTVAVFGFYGDPIKATNYSHWVRTAKPAFNRLYTGPRTLATSTAYSTESAAGTVLTTNVLGNVSEFPHSAGIFQMRNIVLGTQSTGRIGTTDDSIVQVTHIGSIVNVLWPDQATLTAPVPGFGELSIGQSPGNLTNAFTYGTAYDTTAYDHLSLYCYALKQVSGTLDDIVIQIQRRPLKSVGFATDQSVEYSGSAGVTEAIYKDILHTKQIDYGDLTQTQVSYVIDVPLVNVREIRIGAKQKYGQVDANQNFLAWGRFIDSKKET